MKTNRGISTLLSVILILILLLVIGGIYFKQKVKSVNIPSKQIPEIVDGEKDPLIEKLSIPEGYSLSVFARNIKGARVIAFDSKGRLLVSQSREGKIVALEDTDNNGTADKTTVLREKLNNPHGMAFDCSTNICYLYVAEQDKLTRYTYDANTPSVSDYRILADLSASISDRHKTRTLQFLPSPNENILLISVGSSCNVCTEKDTMRGRIMSYDTKTGKLETYAEGLRNSVFMTLHPVTGAIFATEMGRDELGDNIPPDEINIIKKGGKYGWPICYGKNIHDTQFDKKTYVRNPCMEPFEIPSFIDLQAHSAPLGLSFIPEEGWPESDWYDLLVSYHGSWNRSEPTGYKIVRIKMDSKGNYTDTEDFITGWLDDDKKIGRPVDIKVLSGGAAYISDDTAGLIYKLTRTHQ